MSVGLSLAHIFIIAPLLIAIGSGRVPALSGYPVAALGGFIVLYHAYRAWGRWSGSGAVPWVNLFHALVIGPLLLAYGLVSPTPTYLGGAIVGLGFAAAGYHSWRLIEQ
jgi:hypothetical protein